MGTDLYGSGSGFLKLNTCGFESGLIHRLTCDVPYFIVFIDCGVVQVCLLNLCQEEAQVS